MSKRKPEQESGNRTEWATPAYVFDELNREFQFTLDVCANLHNHKVDRYFDETVDALKQDWSNDVCWMNCPYGRNIGAWMQKAYEESTRGAIVVCLIPASTNTKWWNKWVLKAQEIRFVVGRIAFLPPKGVKKQSGCDHASAVVVFVPGAQYHWQFHAFTTCKFVKPEAV